MQRRLATGSLGEHRSDRVGVLGVGSRTEVTGEVDPGRAHRAELEGVATALAEVVRLPGDVDEPIADDQGTSVVADALVGVEQVREDARRDRARVDRLKVGRERLARRRVRLVAPTTTRLDVFGELEQVVARELLAAVERVREEPARTADPHEKVTWKSDAVDLEPDPPPDRHHDHGEGDGNAEPAVEHLVQVAVAGVVVARLVAAEAELAEEVGIHDLGLLPRPAHLGDRRAEALRDGVEAREVARDVEAWIGVRSDRESDPLDRRVILRESANEGPTTHPRDLARIGIVLQPLAMLLGDPIDPRVPWIRALRDLEETRAVSLPAERIRATVAAGQKLGDDLRTGPRVLGVKTLEVTTLPYPTRFAFNGAVPLPWPFVILTHRTLLVRLATDEGQKHLLFNPTDAEASRATPFFRKLADSIASKLPFAERLLAKPCEPLEAQLAKVGVRPEDIDVVAYDHFHTQDLRSVLGTGKGAGGRFPNAVLLAPEREWRDWDGVHPMQRAWMIEDGKRGVPESRVVTFDADVTLGGGAVLLRTHGHTSGNQTLFVHGAEGVFGCSENGCSVDNWSPRASTIPGLRSYAEQYDVDVILNANTPELAGEQYASMMLERSLVDPVRDAPDLVQMFPSSEVTHGPIAPLVRPRVELRHRDSGMFARA